MPPPKTARLGVAATKLRRTDSTTVSLGKPLQRPVCSDVPSVPTRPPSAAALQPKALATKPAVLKPATPKLTAPHPPTFKPAVPKPVASKPATPKPSATPTIPKPVAPKPAAPKIASLSPVVLKAKAGPYAPTVPKPTWSATSLAAPTPIVAPVRDFRVQPALFIYRSTPHAHDNPGPPPNPSYTPSRKSSKMKHQQSHGMVAQGSRSLTKGMYPLLHVNNI